jgi:hypothetical protein
MLSAAAVIPRLRFATRPRLRRPSARTYWPRPLSSSHVTPAAAAGVLEPPDLTRLANAARISLSPQEVSRRTAFFLSRHVKHLILCAHERLTLCLCCLRARSPGPGLRAQDSAGRGLVSFRYLFSSVCNWIIQGPLCSACRLQIVKSCEECSAVGLDKFWAFLFGEPMNTCRSALLISDWKCFG